MYTCALVRLCHRTHVEVRWWLAVVYMFWGSNPGCQTWWQVPSPAGPPFWLLFQLFLHAKYCLKPRRRQGWRTHLLHLLISPYQPLVLKACQPSLSSQKDAGRHELISRWQMRSGADGVQQWAWEREYITAESGLVCSWRLPQTHNSYGQGKMTVYNKFPKLARRIRGRRRRIHVCQRIDWGQVSANQT